MRFTVTSWPRFILFILFALAVVALLVWGVIFAFRFSLPKIAQPDVPQPTPSVAAAQFEAEPLTALIIQVDSKREQRRLVSCKDEHCEAQQIPAPAEESVTDGEHWYYYSEKENSKNEDETLRTLIRRLPDGSEQTLIEQTPLVKPRGLYISPDSQKIAFWLDNTEDPKAELTELWVYEHESGGTRLLAENIHQPDVLTKPRWNSASTHLAFIADNAPAENPKASKIELVTVNLQSAKINAKFSQVDWATHQELFESGTLDIQPAAEAIALAKPQADGTTNLSVIAADKDIDEENKIVPGPVPYVRWLQDGTLIYVVAGKQDFSFWRLQGNTHRFIARQPGAFRSALANGSEEQLLIAAEDNKKPHLLSLQLSSGTITEQGSIPAFGESLHIVQVDGEMRGPTVAGASTKLADEELLAFIEQQQAEIVGSREATPVRIVTTTEANTIYFDYRLPDNTEERLLLIIRDAIHPEWETVARYQRLGADWAFVEGNRESKSPPARSYEWENSAGQWILKQELLPKH